MYVSLQNNYIMALVYKNFNSHTFILPEIKIFIKKIIRSSEFVKLEIKFVKFKI